MKEGLIVLRGKKVKSTYLLGKCVSILKMLNICSKYLTRQQ